MVRIERYVQTVNEKINGIFILEVTPFEKVLPLWKIIFPTSFSQNLYTAANRTM
jgi:hypothetical protein